MGSRPVEDATVTVKEIGSTPSSRLEHGSVVDEETAGRMRERGVYLVSTMFVYAAMNARGPELDTRTSSSARPRGCWTTAAKLST